MGLTQSYAPLLLRLLVPRPLLARAAPGAEYAAYSHRHHSQQLNPPPQHFPHLHLTHYFDATNRMSFFSRKEFPGGVGWPEESREPARNFCAVIRCTCLEDHLPWGCRATPCGACLLFHRPGPGEFLVMFNSISAFEHPLSLVCVGFQDALRLVRLCKASRGLYVDYTRRHSAPNQTAPNAGRIWAAPGRSILRRPAFRIASNCPG